LIHEVLVTVPGESASHNPIVAYHSTPEQAAATFSQVNPRMAVYTHIVGDPGPGGQTLIARTRAARYTGPLELGQDMYLVEIGDSIQVLHCPPVGAAVTNASYQNRIFAGDTAIAWGTGFSIGGNELIWTSPNGSRSITLSESDGLFFWDQARGQINAALPTSITPGTWYVQVANNCILRSAPLPVTVS
jgi:hypothetical protein